VSSARMRRGPLARGHRESSRRCAPLRGSLSGVCVRPFAIDSPMFPTVNGRKVLVPPYGRDDELDERSCAVEGVMYVRSSRTLIAIGSR
jgi:hypothetical protein